MTDYWWPLRSLRCRPDLSLPPAACRLVSGPDTWARISLLVLRSRGGVSVEASRINTAPHMQVYSWLLSSNPPFPFALFRSRSIKVGDPRKAWAREGGKVDLKQNSACLLLLYIFFNRSPKNFPWNPEAFGIEHEKVWCKRWKCCFPIRLRFLK